MASRHPLQAVQGLREGLHHLGWAQADDCREWLSFSEASAQQLLGRDLVPCSNFLCQRHNERKGYPIFKWPQLEGAAAFWDLGAPIAGPWKKKHGVLCARGGWPHGGVLCKQESVISRVIFGHPFDIEDKVYQKLIECIEYEAHFFLSTFHLLYELFPWLMRRLPGPHQKAFSCLEHIHSFGRSEIRRHKEKRETDEPRDFIDFYLDEINKKKDDPESTFDEANLVHVIYDLFTAGIDTGSSTLSWALLFMVIHPDVQEKVQAEIDAAVTRSQRISYEDRMNLPYTNAVIHEIQRYKYVLLVGNFRQCAKDTTMFGFPIKKDTVIIPDIASALYDPEEWETPHQFNPNHFLDKEGNFFVRDAFIPFSIGKRFCLGENLARMEIFLFFTNLLQAFTLRLPDGVRELNTNGVRGRLAVQPYPYTICAVPRKATAWKREPEASQRA
nr:cytochrome P450 2J2-like isoform X3 [Zootoca vivipara]